MSNPPVLLNVVRLVRGQTKVLRITVKERTGAPANLAGATIYFTARETPTSEVLICKTNGDGVTIDDPANGIATITLNSEDTEIERGSYLYDVWVEYGGDPPIRHPVVKSAELCVEERLGAFGCP